MASPTYKRALLYLVTNSKNSKREHLKSLKITRLIAFLFKKTVSKVADDALEFERRALLE